MKRKIERIVMLVLLGSLCFTACSKNNKTEEENNVTETPTQVVTVTPTMEPTELPTATPTEIPAINVTKEDAINSILKVIGERGYFVETLNEELKLNESSYYVLQISNSGEVIEPNVIVDKSSGEILCFYADGTTDSFTEYPLFSNVTDLPTEGEGGFTKEEALLKLEQIPAETLGLEKSISEYTIIYDNWTSYAGGKLCYGINVTTETETTTDFVGTYYVAVDGVGVYAFDDVLDDFVEIAK
ncbi:MAG: PT domain-containing protein [Anaerocolumna sp.]